MDPRSSGPRSGADARHTRSARRSGARASDPRALRCARWTEGVRDGELWKSRARLRETAQEAAAGVRGVAPVWHVRAVRSATDKSSCPGVNIMRTLTRCSTLLALLVTVTPLQAQDREGVMGDLIRDVATVETKILALARTMPPTVYEWRPAKAFVPPARFSSTSQATTISYQRWSAFRHHRKLESMVETTRRLRRSRHGP